MGIKSKLEDQKFLDYKRFHILLGSLLSNLLNHSLLLGLRHPKWHPCEILLVIFEIQFSEWSQKTGLVDECSDIFQRDELTMFF